MGTCKLRLITATLSSARHLPLWACRCLGRYIGLLLWLIPNRNRSITLANIALCFPGFSWREKQRLAFHSLQHTGILVFETAAIWAKPYAWLNAHIVQVNNKTLFDTAQATERGLILLLPHAGNWEVFSSYIPQLSPMKALYKPSKLPEFDTLVKSAREKTGAELLPITQGGLTALLKHLRRGGTTCILPDQVPKRSDRGAVVAPFFGRPALTMTLVSQLAQKTGCQILTATAKQVSGGFEIDFRPVSAAVYSSDELESVTAINAAIEQCIRAMPTQYQWEYKRFRRVPQEPNQQLTITDQPT